MGFFLWGVALGWGVCVIYRFSQSENEKVGNGATIITGLLIVTALIVSLSLGIASGAIAPEQPPVTPTSLGR
jgi:hypothetical protein